MKGEVWNMNVFSWSPARQPNILISYSLQIYKWTIHVFVLFLFFHVVSYRSLVMIILLMVYDTVELFAEFQTLL